MGKLIRTQVVYEHKPGNLKQSVKLRLPIIIHSSKAGPVIIINYPGYNGDIDGYNMKYAVMATRMSEQIGTVIRIGNHHHSNTNYQETVQDDLRAIVTHALENAKEICGHENPHIYITAFSAGASAAAAIAHEFPQVTKLLLISPSFDAGESAIRSGLEKYTGEIHILAGANDDVVGPEVAPLMNGMVKLTASQMVILPKCDHQLRGRTNGLYLSNAPGWAFLGKKFPTTDDGIVLYE